MAYVLERKSKIKGNEPVDSALANNIYFMVTEPFSITEIFACNSIPWTDRYFYGMKNFKTYLLYEYYNLSKLQLKIDLNYIESYTI